MPGSSVAEILGPPPLPAPLAPDVLDALARRLDRLDRRMDAAAAARRLADIAEALAGGPPTPELFELAVAVGLWGRYRCALRDARTPGTAGVRR